MRRTSRRGLLAIALLATSAPATARGTGPGPAGSASSAPSSAPSSPSLDGRIAAASVAFVDVYRAGDFAAIEARFDDHLQRVLSHDQVVATAAQVAAQVGPMERCEAPIARPTGRSTTTTATPAGNAVTVVDVRCDFARGPLIVRLAWTADVRLSGLFFTPAPSPAAAPNVPLPTNVRDESLVTGAAGWPLPATLLVPTGATRPPVAVLVHGSGPNDRDETIGPNRVFGDLARGLAAHGIASLRYDKRTFALAARFTGELPAFTLDDEVVDDAVAALGQVARRADLGPVFVVGHSLGAWLAPRIALRARAAGIPVAGIVMRAGNATPLADLLLDQYRFARVDTPPRASADDVAAVEVQRDNVARLVANGRTVAGHEALPLGLPASAWLDIARYDPVATLRSLRAPALLTFGERDYQVPIAEKAVWSERLGDRDDTTVVAFPRVNHLLIEGDGPPGAAEYATPGHVAAVVVDRVAEWIRAHAGRSR